MNNKISGDVARDRGRTVNDNPFEIAASAKNHTFESVNIKNFASAKKEPNSGIIAVKRPGGVLAPVADPKKRDHSVGGSSAGED